MMSQQVNELMMSGERSAIELTPAQIRGMLFELARRRIDERTARPAIVALNRIMRDSFRRPLPNGPSN